MGDGIRIPGGVMLQAAAAATASELLALVLPHLPAAGLRIVDLANPDDQVVGQAGLLHGAPEPFPLPGTTEVLQVAWTGPFDDTNTMRAITGMLSANRQRQLNLRLAGRVSARTDQAQAMAHMGDYVWDIPTDTLSWSDELYRIYGMEPQSRPMSYETFLDMVHPEDQARMRGLHQNSYASGQPFHATERIVRPNGDIRVLESTGVVERAADGTPLRMHGCCVDVTARDRAEKALRQSVEDVVELDVRLQDVRLRRQHALALNDNVIQGLAAIAMAMEDGRDAAAGIYLQRTLQVAREMMTDLLTSSEDRDITPEDLLRDEPVVLAPEIVVSPPPPSPPPSTASVTDQIRVLLVDDSADIRFLLRTNLDNDGRFQVVGEAANGKEAIEMSGRLQPDTVLLDVAMPIMDGLTALPQIRKVAPHAALIVLSAFGEEQMADSAIQSGASAYVEKGGAMRDVITVILSHISV